MREMVSSDVGRDDGGELRAADFSYLAEGSAHLVLSYCGKFSANLSGRIIRVGLCGAADSGEKEVEFVRKVALPLFGESYVDPGQSIACSEDFLRDISVAIGPHRSLAQQNSHLIDFSQRQVTVLRDYVNALGPGGWCVEIKPKYFLTSRTRLLPNHLRAKFQVPFFKILFPDEDVQQYSPADILSGEENRIRTALHELWSHQHRWLRVFHQGKPICLREASNAIEKQVLHAASKALSAESACLQKIAEVQNMEYIDSYGAKLIADELQKREEAESQDLQSLLWHMYTNLELYQDLPREAVSYTTSAEAIELHNSGSFEAAKANVESMGTGALLGLLGEYMISAVAKDLSVLVALKETADGWDHVVGVVDVSLKGVDKIDKWFQRDVELVEKFVSRNR